MSERQAFPLSIITVTLNNADGLEKTLNSIWQQENQNFQHIIIDGASTDETPELIAKAQAKIDIYLSEPDLGTYHAMNKGIKLATGDWLIFMNAGDTFTNNQVLSELTNYLTEDTDVVYSDWIYTESQRLVKADLVKLNVRHQSVVYRKSLHQDYGYYVVGKKVSIADYLFFLAIREKSWRYFPKPISICEQSGISAHPAHFYQRLASELIFGQRSRLSCASILLIYPIYRLIKRNLLLKR